MQNELLNENYLHLNLNQTITNFIPFMCSEYSFKLDRKTKIQLYLAAGIGLILFKLWPTMALLTVVIAVQISSIEPMYWTTNGFLFSFGVGGFMATTANLIRTFQLDFLDIGVLSPVTVILIYLGLTTSVSIPK